MEKKTTPQSSQPPEQQPPQPGSPQGQPLQPEQPSNQPPQPEQPQPSGEPSAHENPAHLLPVIHLIHLVRQPLRPLMNAERVSIMAMLDQKLWEQGYERITEDLLVAGVSAGFMKKRGSFADLEPSTVNDKGMSPVTLGVDEDDMGVHIAAIVPIEAASGNWFRAQSLIPGGPKYLVSLGVVTLRDRDHVAKKMDDIKNMYLQGELRFMESGIPAQQIFDHAPRFQPISGEDLDLQRRYEARHEQAGGALNEIIQGGHRELLQEAIRVRIIAEEIRKRCIRIGAVTGVVLMVSGVADTIVTKASDEIQEIAADTGIPEIAESVFQITEKGEEIFAARKEDIFIRSIADGSGGVLAGRFLGGIIGKLWGNVLRKRHNNKIRRKQQERRSREK